MSIDIPTVGGTAEKLVWLDQQLKPARDELRRAIVALAAAQKRATLVEAEAFISETGAMDLRKWKAREAAADAQYEVGCAEAVVAAARTYCYNLSTSVSVAQSLGAILRSEMSLAGSGMTP